MGRRQPRRSTANVTGAGGVYDRRSANVKNRGERGVRLLIEAGTVRPVIDRTYPLAEVPDAIRYLETMRARGKVVITV